MLLHLVGCTLSRWVSSHYSAASTMAKGNVLLLVKSVVVLWLAKYYVALWLAKWVVALWLAKWVVALWLANEGVFVGVRWTEVFFVFWPTKIFLMIIFRSVF